LQICNLFVIINLVIITKCNFLKAVTVIFANLDLKAKAEQINKFIKNNRIFRFVSCCVLATAAVGITVLASGVTVGYTVSYSDKVIAVVSCEADYEKADAIVSSRLDEKTASKASIKPTFGRTLTVSDKINNTDEVVDAILNNNEDIIEATGLVVNGNIMYCTESGDLQSILDARLAQYNIDGAENKSEFVDDVKVEKGYFLKSDFAKTDLIKAYVNNLDVKTVSIVTTQIEVPHETKNVKTDKQVIGYSKVTTKGENGITERTKEVTRINGEVKSSVKLSDKVIKKQVTEIVTIGTAVKTVKPTYKINPSNSGFIRPLPKGSYVVSAYYGDGRNHKGIDLAADCGTPIFSVLDGTVTYAGYDGDYGYSVVVSHSNGMKTRYAHCNALCVSVGAKVSRGDMIATVGNTGWSTGNHLHFEIIINGNRVNPGPYIGLN